MAWVARFQEPLAESGVEAWAPDRRLAHHAGPPGLCFRYRRAPARKRVNPCMASTLRLAFMQIKGARPIGFIRIVHEWAVPQRETHTSRAARTLHEMHDVFQC